MVGDGTTPLSKEKSCPLQEPWRRRRDLSGQDAAALELPRKKRSLEWNQNRESSIVGNRPNEVQGTNKLCDLIRKLCVGMVKVKKVENPSEETRALRMIARANRLKDIILDELYGLHDSGVNISKAQVQEIAARNYAAG